MSDHSTPQTTRNLTFKAEAIELAGDVGDEAFGVSAKAKFSNEVTDHAVQGFIVSFHSLRSQHVLPQETSDRLPLLPLTRNTHIQRELPVIIASVHTIQQHYFRVLPIFIITPFRIKEV